MTQNRKVFVYDRRARIYESLMNSHRYGVTLHDFIILLQLELNSQKPSILDLGCGTGMTTQAIKEKFPFAILTCFFFFP